MATIVVDGQDGRVPYDVRPIGPDDREAAWRLGSLAFGYHAEPMPEAYDAQPGRTAWGAYDGDGRLVGKAVDREQGHWFGGRVVPTAGVAGVAVAPELRGRGVARQLLTRLLAGARERGAVISTLFPTTAVPYRRAGWETVGALTYTAWPASVLASVGAGGAVALRPASAGDVPGIAALYRDVARAGTGMMERSGPAFTADPERLLKAFDGLTVAVSPSGELIGYASWNRGRGYDPSSKVTVYDLVGMTADATSALLAMFGSWASVAPTVVVRLSTSDPARLLFPPGEARIESYEPWMLRVVDAPGAVAARGWPANLSGELDLDLVDDECPWNAGPYRLVLAGGEGRLEPGGSGHGVRLTARGLAAWYAGAASPDVLRRAGLLAGGDAGDRGPTGPGTDDLLLAATAGPPATLHDYF
jgi:predicted acetyltransferase